ncbi:hypothetical protein J4462_04835 [Candidatus Pacearchaeota archaeon]|nr:hypothetical protein [Candidatus Pacearchaeota archaeon]
MKILDGVEEEEAFNFLTKAYEAALKSSCGKDKCGSVIVKDEEIIGEGFNSPPGNLEGQRRCNCDKKKLHKKVTDKTCCVHAEQRAVMDALSKNSDKLNGSRLYFIRLDDEGKISFAGKPYCTVCSKMALDSGIKEFVLYHKEGIGVYDTGEYNLLSYGYSD